MFLRWYRNRKREKVRRQTPPNTWRQWLAQNMPHWERLSESERTRLLSHIQILLAEKEFVGCGGLEVSEEMKVTIAGWASLLILNRETDYYPHLSQILLYPDSFRVPVREPLEAGDVIEGEDVRDGESWQYGSVILAWESVLEACQTGQGFNVVLHEFAHQLDQEDGISNGTPPLSDREMLKSWHDVMTREFNELRVADEEGEDTLLDPYGAESPAEFFAVATETFFDLPHRMQQEAPELYVLLARYYRQDPASLLPKNTRSATFGQDPK